MPDARDPVLTTACRSCGYLIGADADPGSSVANLELSCPECGDPEANARTGTPWQIRSGAGSLLISDVMTLLNPLSVFRRAAFWTTGNARACRLLLILNAVLGASIISAAVLSVWVLKAIAGAVSDPSNPETWVIIAQLFIVLVTTQVSLLLIAAWLKELLIRAVPALFGVEVRPAVAMTIGAHASSGFVFGALLFAAAAQLAKPIGHAVLPLIVSDRAALIASVLDASPIAALCLGTVLGWRAVSAGLRAAIESGAVKLKAA